CSEGEEIVQICNATMDLLCGLPDQGMVHRYPIDKPRNGYLAWMTIIIILVAAGFAGLFVFYILKKFKSDKGP
ncbi:hypothetical protein ASZ78_008840, partial [Callipepla squamata]